MSTTIASAVASLRQPEYTGENRCIPCTVTNLAIAVVLSAVVAIAFPFLAAALFVVSVAAIYFRGYLVPGTPELTKRYFPDWLLAKFDKLPETDPVQAEDLDLEAALVDAGALVECEDVDDLCLDDAFRDAWHDRIETVRERDTGRRVLTDLLDVDEDDLTFQEYGEAFVALVDGRRVARWESRAAFLADVAAAELLRERSGDWHAFSIPARGRLMSGLRIFLDTCPACGGDLRFGEETVESCCREYEVVAVTCDSCGARVFEADAPAA
ncbi:hypothetical protein ACFQH6_15860 [Halobacteriaceae archaeon GCM10025711]